MSTGTAHDRPSCATAAVSRAQPANSSKKNRGRCGPGSAAQRCCCRRRRRGSFTGPAGTEPGGSSETGVAKEARSRRRASAVAAVEPGSKRVPLCRDGCTRDEALGTGAEMAVANSAWVSPQLFADPARAERKRERRWPSDLGTVSPGASAPERARRLPRSVGLRVVSRCRRLHRIPEASWRPQARQHWQFRMGSGDLPFSMPRTSPMLSPTDRSTRSLSLGWPAAYRSPITEVRASRQWIFPGWRQAPVASGARRPS